MVENAAGRFRLPQLRSARGQRPSVGQHRVLRAAGREQLHLHRNHARRAGNLRLFGGVQGRQPRRTSGERGRVRARWPADHANGHSHADTNTDANTHADGSAHGRGRSSDGGGTGGRGPSHRDGDGQDGDRRPRHSGRATRSAGGNAGSHGSRRGPRLRRRTLGPDRRADAGPLTVEAPDSAGNRTATLTTANGLTIRGDTELLSGNGLLRVQLSNARLEYAPAVPAKSGFGADFSVALTGDPAAGSLTAEYSEDPGAPVAGAGAVFSLAASLAADGGTLADAETEVAFAVKVTPSGVFSTCVGIASEPFSYSPSFRRKPESRGPCRYGLSHLGRMDSGFRRNDDVERANTNTR